MSLNLNSGVPGNTTGNAIAAGFVGEKIAGIFQSPAIGSASAYTTIWQISLNQGIYLIFGQIELGTSASAAWGSDPYLAAVLATTPGSELFATYVSDGLAVAASARDVAIMNHFVIPSAGTTVYLQGRHNLTTTTSCTWNTASNRTYLYAVRIA